MASIPSCTHDQHRRKAPEDGPKGGTRGMKGAGRGMNISSLPTLRNVASPVNLPNDHCNTLSTSPPYLGEAGFLFSAVSLPVYTSKCSFSLSLFSSTNTETCTIHSLTSNPYPHYYTSSSRPHIHLYIDLYKSAGISNI